MPVALRNRSKRPVTFVVTHPDAPKVDIPFVQQVHDPKTGELTQRRKPMRLPESVTLLGGETRGGFADYVVREATRAGLEVVRDEPAKAAEPKTAADANGDKPQIALKEKKKGSA